MHDETLPVAKSFEEIVSGLQVIQQARCAYGKSSESSEFLKHFCNARLKIYRVSRLAAAAACLLAYDYGMSYKSLCCSCDP